MATHDEILKVVQKALATGKFDFTSQKSIRIYYRDYFTEDGIPEGEVRCLELEWKIV